MKTIIAILMITMGLAEASFAQTVNWRSLRNDQHNLVRVDFGYDYGVTTQLSYHRSMTIIRPALVGLDFSMPMGGNLLDDFKVRLGGQVELFENNGFSTSVRIQGVFRRFQNDFVRIVSFGSDFGLVAGYYSQTWHAAGEFGFDKSITTHLKHSEVLKSYIPDIKDGWYIPTGGHFYYGVQGSKTLVTNLDLSLRVGATKAQFNDKDAALPAYLQLGLGMQF